MKTIDEQLKEIQIALLQLQRSALVDTQAVMQIMLDKGLCTAEDIVETRIRIEEASPDVQRIDNQIMNSGGTVSSVPQSNVESNKPELNSQLKVLRDLLKQLPEE